MDWIHLPSKQQNHSPAWQMVSVEFSMVLVSVDLVGNFLDDSLVGKTEIGVIEHRDDQMFMDDDTHDFAGMNDSLGNCEIFGGGRYIATSLSFLFI